MDTDVAISGNNNAPSGGDTEIDLYADVVENELVNETGDDYANHDQHLGQDGDLYDDVITTQPSTTDFTDITNTVHDNHNRPDLSNGPSMGGHNPSNNYGGKRISLYVGQLTWWTTDADLIDAIHELGVNDLLEVKFHENRVNGQSKGFAVVTVGSETSSRAISEKLPKREVHGQNAMVLPCNKQSLNFFEGSTRKDAPTGGMPQMGAAPLASMMHPSMGLPLPMPRAGPLDGPYRFHPQGPVILPGGPPGMGRPPMQMTMGLRGPVGGGPMMVGRMPGPHPGNVHQPHQVVTMQQPPRAGMPPGPNGPHMMRQPMRPGAPGIPVSSASMPLIPGQHPQSHYPGQPGPGQGMSPYGHPMPSQPHPDAYYRPGETRPESNTGESISPDEFQEIMGRNKTVSSSAISRAVQDASTGECATAIETLVTAISLIKQSKIANDDRCKILIASLQDTLKGIEDKFYGSRSHHRSRSGSRESSRKKHRHRTRSPRDRNEYRRSEDYDGKYSREHRRR